MKLDIFSEVQKARPWPPEHEHAVLSETLEQARLADELGFGAWWEVEHHAATEFSYSAAPELILTAIALQTQQMHVGHAGVLAPFRVNHPLRVAERAATLDHLSKGRFQLGLARSGGLEWDTFRVDPETSRDQLREAMHMIPRMWTEESFSWESDLITIPERNVIPKPYQKPHPPLWQTATSPESFELAGSMGVGALATTLLTPLDTMASLLDTYRAAVKACEKPAGKFVNAQTAVFTFVHVAETTKQAIDSGACREACWYVNAAPRVFQVSNEIFYSAIRGEYLRGDPAAIAALEAQDESGEAVEEKVPVVALLKRLNEGQDVSNEEIYETLAPIESVIVGDVETCRAKMKHYRDIGVDRLMCFYQIGALPQERILRSMRLTGQELMDAFV
jgi:alkanesulfonate monooxygenase SsuD/methylene tetrahydromethanopterin reductase-like flavin-dependent oxidoreductase (luciferase family)